MEKIDPQEAIHAPTCTSETSERQIPGTHPMRTRLLGTNLKIFDFASDYTFGC